MRAKPAAFRNSAVISLFRFVSYDNVFAPTKAGLVTSKERLALSTLNRCPPQEVSTRLTRRDCQNCGHEINEVSLRRQVDDVAGYAMTLECSGQKQSSGVGE